MGAEGVDDDVSGFDRLVKVITASEVGDVHFESCTDGANTGTDVAFAQDGDVFAGEANRRNWEGNGEILGSIEVVVETTHRGENHVDDPLGDGMAI